MKPLIHFALLLGFIICFTASCKKDNTQSRKKVYAGVYDDDFIFKEFFPPLQVNFKWDSLNLYSYGSDSIDFDRDGQFDLIIQASLLNNDSLHLITGYPDPFPHYLLLLRNDLQIAFYWENYYFTPGQTAAQIFVDTLSYNIRIDNISNLEVHPFKTQLMWEENQGGEFTPSYGGWYNAKNTKYLGIKLNDRFGWIEVDNTDNFHPKFVSYAIVK